MEVSEGVREKDAAKAKATAKGPPSITVFAQFRARRRAALSAASVHYLTACDLLQSPAKGPSFLSGGLLHSKFHSSTNEDWVLLLSVLVPR